ncbi:hypothetical protein EIP86_008516 [Pleurotus ostreatoroseus]|nr:hypothetical protein EIP86_008516 [Pleurotus ostreatoroseus]
MDEGSLETNELTVVGSLEMKELNVVGSLEMKELTVVGSLEMKELTVDGSLETNELTVVGSDDGSAELKMMEDGAAELKIIEDGAAELSSEVPTATDDGVSEGAEDTIKDEEDVETTNEDYLTGAPDLDTALLQHHLSPVGKPPDNAWDDEEHRKEIQREAWTYGTLAQHAAVDAPFNERDVNVSERPQMGLALDSYLLRRHGLDSGSVGVVYTRGKRDIPEVHIRRQLALDKIIILHRGVMEGHRRLE